MWPNHRQRNWQPVHFFCQLTASLGRLTMFDNFLIDYKHYNNSVREVILGQAQSDTHGSQPAWQALKTGTLQYCIWDHRSAAQSLVSCVSMLPSSPKDESDSAVSTTGLTIPTARPRHCSFIPLNRSAVLTYCCRMLTSLLQEKALFPGAGGDLAMGHCMVLLQYNWADSHDNRELFYHLLNRVRGKDGFTYPLFCKYIINIDILQVSKRSRQRRHKKCILIFSTGIYIFELVNKLVLT